MALFIQLPVTVTLKLGSFFGRDDWLPSIFIDIVDQLKTIITTVRKYIASFYIYVFQDWDGKIDVTTLSFAKHQIDRIAVSVYGRMDFGTGTSPAVSDFVWRPPFLLRHCVDEPGQLWHPVKAHKVRPQG